MLLVSKSIALTESGPIYRIHSGHFSGFQMGDPVRPPYTVKLHLFDPADRHYEILISSPPESGPTLTQPQLNAIVASIQPRQPR